MHYVNRYRNIVGGLQHPPTTMKEYVKVGIYPRKFQKFKDKKFIKDYLENGGWIFLVAKIFFFSIS